MRTGLARQDARDDFDRARRRASWAKLAGWLHGRPSGSNRLPVLGEVTIIAGAAGPSVRRLEYKRVGRLRPNAEAMVAIDQIVGTVEPTRCFDRRFRPNSEATAVAALAVPLWPSRTDGSEAGEASGGSVARETGLARAEGGGDANTGVRRRGGLGPARAERTGPAIAQGPGSRASSGVEEAD